MLELATATITEALNFMPKTTLMLETALRLRTALILKTGCDGPGL